MAKPNENWQERVYEAYTSNVKLDINNPQEALRGPIVYNWMVEFVLILLVQKGMFVLQQ